jgi:hypothetical protein
LKDCVWWGCQLVSDFESRFFLLKLKRKYKKKHRRHANEREKRNVFRTKEMMEIKMKDLVIRKERRKGNKEEIKKWKALLI